MKKWNAVLGAALAFSVCVGAIHAQVPKNEAQVPLYPGAARDKETESVNAEIMGDQNIGEIDQITGLEPLDRVMRVWTVAAAPEEVYAFYTAKLGAKPGDSFSADPQALRPGQASTPVAILYPYDPAEDFQDQYDDHDLKTRDGKIRKAKVESRKKTADGQWVQSADFSWISRGSADECAEFLLTVTDSGFDNGDKAYAHKTMIELTITRSKIHPRDDFGGMDDGDNGSGAAELAAYLRKNPPTEKTLGVAVYPGARFNADASAEMSSEDAMYYVYESTDASGAIVKFYEQKTGKKAQALDDGMFLFALRGPALMPTQGLAVQPNTMLGGSAKSVITVQIAQESD